MKTQLPPPKPDVHYGWSLSNIRTQAEKSIVNFISIILSISSAINELLDQKVNAIASNNNNNNNNKIDNNGVSTLASTAFDDVLAPLAENAVDASSYHSYHPAPLNQAPESANGFLDWSAALNGLEKGRKIKGKYSGQ